MRYLLTAGRVAVVVLTGRGPALLTDWYEAIPEAGMRWLLANVARLRPEDVHEWLCDAGLCPCGVELDVDEPAGALAVAA